MRNNILTLLVGFVVMLGSLMLFKFGLDKMTDAHAASTDTLTRLDVDLERRAILYRVQPGDTLWTLAERFYGSGRRWQQIAQANSIPEGQGLVSGSVIRIPLVKQEAEELAHVPEPEVLVLPDPAEDLSPSGRFAIDDSAIGVALCRLGSEHFPDGALCVARVTEDNRVRLNIFDAADSRGAPLAIYESPAGNHLRELRAEDIDGDGKHEVYTIWRTDADECTSRVFKWVENELRMISETPNDPLALLRLRARGGH
jgi:hypothetical protein